MCLMNSIFSEYFNKFVLVFIDDIHIFYKDEQEHEEFLRIVFQTLREHQIYTKFSKCEFYKDQVQYLGHIDSKKGIIVDLDKIKAIMEWTTPINVYEIRYFMGLVGYYHMFIEWFYKIAYLITSLMRN